MPDQTVPTPEAGGGLTAEPPKCRCGHARDLHSREPHEMSEPGRCLAHVPGEALELEPCGCERYDDEPPLPASDLAAITEAYARVVANFPPGDVDSALRCELREAVEAIETLLRHAEAAGR